jgi:hypothetical protein
MDCRTIEVALAPFLDGNCLILIDKITNTVIGKIFDFDETEIYRIVADKFGDDVQYKLDLRALGKS